MNLRKLISLLGVVSLIATILALVLNSPWSIYPAITALILFLAEAWFIRERHLDQVGIIVIVLIMIIIYKIFL